MIPFYLYNYSNFGFDEARGSFFELDSSSKTRGSAVLAGGSVALADGSLYEGDFIDGLPTGLGMVTYPDRRVYEGEFLNGAPNGQGTLTYPDGSVYKGGFLNGIPCGEGKKFYPGGGVYEGDFLNGKSHGKGTFTCPSGVFYKGEFAKGKPHGKGTSVFLKGNRYQGEFVNGKPHGRGELTYVKGDFYKGEFLRGHPHGIGVLIFGKGDRYEGEFLNGRTHGRGKATYVNGDCYEGSFLNGQPHGKGILRFGAGGWYEGEFANGLPHGKGKQRDSFSSSWMGSICKLEYSFGKIQGVIKRYTLDGEFIENDYTYCSPPNTKSANAPKSIKNKTLEKAAKNTAISPVDPSKEIELEIKNLRNKNYSRLIHLYRSHGDLFENYREGGVLIPELRFLWGAAGIIHLEELRLLVSNQAVRREVNWVQLAKTWKTPLWSEFIDAGAFPDVLPLIVEYLRVSKSHQLPAPIYKKIAALCLQDQEILEPYREQGVLIPELRWLWAQNLSITEEESCALMMNPARYQGVDWHRIVRFWSKETWLNLLAECGPVGVLKFFRDCLQSDMRGVLSVEVEERLAKVCQQAPTCLDPYREEGVLIPELRHLWSRGVAMTRADVFALVDDPMMRQQMPAWPNIAKNWPEKWWAALLLERGIHSVLAVLNEQPAKEWKSLFLIERRGLSIERGKLISGQKDVGESQGSLIQGGEGGCIAVDPRLESVEVRPELVVHASVFAKLKVLTGVEADAVRIWIDNAAVGWYGNERSTVISHKNKKWLHAHINVPGGVLFVVGYQRDRVGSKCQVGWLMRGHNYEADLKQALPDDTDDEQVHWEAIREEVVKATERPASSTTPESTASSGSPANTPAALTVDLLSGDAPSFRGQSSEQDLLDALRGGSSGHGAANEQDGERLALWEARVGIEHQETSFSDRLGLLELWSESLVEAWQGAVLGFSPTTSREKGHRSTHIYRMGKIWDVSIKAVNRFFPEENGEELMQWSHLMARIEELAFITAEWPKEAWAEDAPELLDISLAKHAPLWRWLKIAKRLGPQLQELGIPKAEWPVKPAEMLRLIQQKKLGGALEVLR